MRKKIKKPLSGLLAVFLCVAINFNPLAVIVSEFLGTEFVQDLGIAGKNIAYLLSNPDRVFADTTDSDDSDEEEEESGGTTQNINVSVDVHCDHSCSFECNFTDSGIISAINNQTTDYINALNSNTTNITDSISTQTEVLDGSLEDIKNSVNAVNATLKGIIHDDLQGIKDQIALQQHQYRVAHLYSLNNKISNCLWRPTIEEVDYAKDYAYVTGQFANIYDGYWNTNISSINKGSGGAQRALEVLGYDALVRREGVIINGGFGAMAIDGQKTYGWIPTAGKLENEVWKNDQYDGYADAYELRDRDKDTLRSLYYQELIPEEEITWLDAVTLLYKAVGQEIQSFESFIVHDSKIKPENSPAYQNLSDIVPGYQNPNTGLYEEYTYNGYNVYMFFSRSNIVYTADDTGNAIGHVDYYWNRAMADGVVMKDNAMNKIRGDELFILASRIMQIYGEPEMNQDEIDALLQVYGKDYPVQLGADVADSWAYLMVRGCLEADISYTGYVSRDQMLDLAMRIKDTDSRTDYKTIQVTLDLADVMISDGWYPVRDLEYTTSASVEMEIDYTIQTHYDYLIRKGEKISEGKDLKFVSANGIEATDLIVSTDVNARHNVTTCVGTVHNISTVSGAEYKGIVTIDGKEYYHLRIPKDAGIGTGFKIFGIIVDADGKEVAATNEYMFIPSNMIGGGVYSGWVADGGGIKATANSFFTFDQLKGNLVYKYTDCVRALDMDVQQQRQLADRSDMTILEYLAYQWDRLTTPMYAEAAPSTAVTTVLLSDGGGSGASAEITLTWKTKNDDGSVNGAINKNTINGNNNTHYNYYNAVEGNSGVARAFRLANLDYNMSTIMRRYDGNLLEDWKNNGLRYVIPADDDIAKFCANALGILLTTEGYNANVNCGTWPRLGTNAFFSTVKRYIDESSRSIDGYTVDETMWKWVRYPIEYWLYSFVNAYAFPSVHNFDGQKDIMFNGGLSTAKVEELNSLLNSTWYEAAIADYNDLREFYQLSGGIPNDVGWSLVELGNNKLQLKGSGDIDTNLAARLGEFLSNGSSSNVSPGSNTVSGSYEDLIDESIWSSTVMDRNQNILISFTDLKKAGFIDPSTDKPVMMNDGAYYLETPKGVVRVNNRTKMISVGGTLYNLANDDGTGPTIAYEDPSQGEWYFDYRCFMGVINVDVTPKDGKGKVPGSSIGCAGSVIYTMSDGTWGSSVFSQKGVNCYNFPDVEGFSTVSNTGTYKVDIISSYVGDGQEINDDTNTAKGLPYWKDMPTDSYRLAMSTFNPTANYLLVIHQTDTSTESSVFVWYPRRAFTDGFIDSNGEWKEVSDAGFKRMYGQDGVGYDIVNHEFKESDDAGYEYARKAVESAGVYGGTTITSLLGQVYDGFDKDNMSGLPWYDVMTIGAAANLYNWTKGGFYLSKDYVIREFPLSWDNSNGNQLSETRMPWGFGDSEPYKTDTSKLNSNRVGACYWLKGVGFVYNLPTVAQWSMEQYLSGQIMLPYAVYGNTLTTYKVVNFNMDSYGTIWSANGSSSDGTPYGTAYADSGIITWRSLRAGSSEVYEGYSTDYFKAGTNTTPVNPTAGSGDMSPDIVYAPVGVFIYFGGSQISTGKVQDMTGYVTNANSVYVGSRRIAFDKIDNSKYMFKIGSSNYESVSLATDTSFIRVHHAYNGSDVWIAANVNVTRNSIGELNPVDVFDTYPNPLQNMFEGLGLDTVLDKIDQGSSLLILFAFYVLPIIGIIIMTFLIGASFIGQTRFAQKICEKFFDPIRILTLGHRDITNWYWRTVIIPCTILYISFALFLNGNIIRVIAWLAECYGVLSRFARRL